MKILHVSDIHLNRAWFAWIAATAPKFDLLIIAGDLQNAFSNLTMIQQARVCRDWLLTLEVPTVVVSGNHDFYGKSPLVSVDVFAEARWLRGLSGNGKIVTTDGETVRFPADNPQLVVSTIGWSQKPVWDSHADILVTHAAPAGVSPGRDYGGAELGDSELRLAMLKNRSPRLVLCGHVHNPLNFWSRWPVGDKNAKTTILNPGCDETSAQPMHWVIDLAAGKATHVGGEEAAVVTI